MTTTKSRWLAIPLLIIILPLFAACATTGPDPWEKTNRAFYRFNDNLDKVALKPAADVYVKYVPKEIRRGVGNGFDNLTYFPVIVNDFLQAKWQQGCSDSARMALNSTVGLGGILDLATPCHLPAHENDFGITLGKWGAKPGPYLVIPLLGPSSARDSTSIPEGIVGNPLTWLDLAVGISIPLDVLHTVDSRSQAQRYIKFRDNTALDPYVFTRDAYLQYRQNLVLDGKPPTNGGIYDEDPEPTTKPATQSATQPATQPH